MTQVWAVTMVRDEEDIIAHTLGQMIRQKVDGIIVADNLSMDGTRTIVETIASQAPIPVKIVEDREKGYYQSRKMTALGAMAASFGADWIIPFDADEFWACYGSPLGDHLRAQPPSIDGFHAYVYNYFPTVFDPPDGDWTRTIRWRKADAEGLGKVCYRYGPDVTLWQGNHGCFSRKRALNFHAGNVQIAHFPWRTFEQFCRKVRLAHEAHSAAPDLNPSYGGHWKPFAYAMLTHGQEGLRRAWENELVRRTLDGMVEEPLFREAGS